MTEAAAAPAPWSPEAATTAASLAPAAAAARIEVLKTDKEFFDALMRKDGGAKAEWDALHKAATAKLAAPTTAPVVDSEADVHAQQDERVKAAWQESVAELRRNGARFTAAQEQDILSRRPISEAEHKFHLDTLESYKRNRELGRKVLQKDPEHYTRYHLALQGAMLPVVRA